MQFKGKVQVTPVAWQYHAWTNVGLSSLRLYHMYLRPISKEVLKIPFCKMNLWKYTSISLNSQWVNSLAPGRFENNFQNVFFKLISWIDTLSNSCKTFLRKMPQNPSDDMSTLVQVIGWCHQAITWVNVVQDHRRHMPSLCLNELICNKLFWCKSHVMLPFVILLSRL